MTVSPTLLFARLSARARLRHLQLISQIGELGSLQKAAEAVHMSQPAATKALAELESVLGVLIFERHSKGMRPTALGDALLPLVRNALHALQECVEVVAAMDAGISSTLRVGAVGAAVSGLLCRAVPAFSRRHPDIVIDVTQSTPEELIMTAVQGSLDIVVCHAPEQLPQGFQFIPITPDRYVVVCSPKHPLAGRPLVSVEDLARHAWLMPPQTGIARRNFQRLWDEMGSGTQMCWVASRSPLLIWAMLEERQLLRFTPYNTVRQWIDAGVLTTIKGPWESGLPPLGAMVRTADGGPQGALAMFIDDLLSWGDPTLV